MWFLTRGRILRVSLLFGALLTDLLASPLPALPQEAVLPAPANLIVEGVPPIPMPLVDAAGGYRTFRAASFQDWHPTKREMLIATQFSDTPQLHIVSSPDGARRQLTFFSDGIAAAQFEPGDGDSIVFMKDANGGESYQLYRYEMDTGKIRLLTDGKSINFLGPWSTRGDRIAYTSTKRTGKDLDLWVINPEEPRKNYLLTQLTGGGWHPLDWSTDDKNILLLEKVSSGESRLWLVETTKGQKTAVTPGNSGEKVSYKDAKFSKDAKSIYLTTNKDSEFSRLAQLELASGHVKYLTGDLAGDVEEFALSQEGNRIAFVTNEDGTSKLRVLDVESGMELPLPALPAGVIRRIRWRRNGQDLGFTLSTARTPPDCYSIDIKAGKVDQWTFSESALKTGDFSLPELARWKSFDGKTISGVLYRPPVKFWGKRPVLVIIHDGPEDQSRPEFVGQNNYFLNELGIALLYPNVRGSSGYGKVFSQLDHGFRREDSYKDIGSLLDWIATRPDLDAEHIAIAGTGYGGHMALVISGLYGDRIRCSMDVAGASNLATFLDRAEGYRHDLLRAKFGDERDPAMREFLERIAPIRNVAKMKKPVLVIAGQNDPRVPLGESEQMVAALKGHGTTVWYLMAKDEGHGFRKKFNQDFQFYASIVFLEEYLLK